MLSKKNLPKLIRRFLIEMAIYAILLIIYFFAVLRFLSGVLSDLYIENIIIYSVAGLGIIVLQAVALEAVTSYLLRLLRLD